MLISTERQNYVRVTIGTDSQLEGGLIITVYLPYSALGLLYPYVLLT